MLSMLMPGPVSQECKDLAQRTFYDILKAKGDKLVRRCLISVVTAGC